MKNVKLIGEMVKVAAKRIGEGMATKGVKINTQVLVTKIGEALQVSKSEEVQTAPSYAEEMMANLLVEQLTRIYTTVPEDRKTHISEKRLNEAFASAKEVASAIFTGEIVDGNTMLERGENYSLQLIDRAFMDSFRDARNAKALEIANMIRDIQDPAVFYSIQESLNMAIESTISAGTIALQTQDEVINTMSEIAEGLIELKPTRIRKAKAVMIENN